MAWTDYLTLKLLNILLVLWFTAANVFVFSLAVNKPTSRPDDRLPPADPSLPPPDRKYGYGLGKETLVTPSPWIYLVLAVVHIGFIGTAAYCQWTETGKEIVLRHLKLRFPLMLVLSIAFTGTWVRQEYAIAFVISLLLAMLTSHIYLTLKREYTREPGLFDGAEQAFVHMPLSLYHAWTLFMAVLAFFAAVFPPSSNATIVSKIFSVWALACLTATSFSYALPGRMIKVGGPGDPLGSLMITLGLWAIFAHQLHANKWVPPPDEKNYRDGEIVTWFALAFAIISTWATGWGVWVFYKAARPGSIRLTERTEDA